MTRPAADLESMRPGAIVSAHESAALRALLPDALAVEKASTIEGLQAVAQRVLVQIGERKGEAVAAAARRSLYGA